MKALQSVAISAVLGLAVVSFPVHVSAVSYGAGPQGSVLFFPYLKTLQERTTIRLTNGGPDTVSVHFVRVCAGILNPATNTASCGSGDFSEELTPDETLNYIVPVFSTQVSGDDCTQGYIVAYVDGIGVGSGDKTLNTYNHLSGEFSIERVPGSGNRMGGAPAIAIKAIDDANASESVLMFDDAELEKVGTKLRTTVRTTFPLLSSRGSKFFFGSFTTDGGKINSVTNVKFDVYPENEIPFSSGNLKYVCARWFDPKVEGISNFLSGGGPGLATQFASATFMATTDNSIVLGDIPAKGIFGYWMREEGGGKRTIEPMWIWDETATTAATFRND